MRFVSVVLCSMAAACAAPPPEPLVPVTIVDIPEPMPAPVRCSMPAPRHRHPPSPPPDPCSSYLFMNEMDAGAWVWQVSEINGREYRRAIVPGDPEYFDNVQWIEREGRPMIWMPFVRMVCLNPSFRRFRIGP